MRTIIIGCLLLLGGCPLYGQIDTPKPKIQPVHKFYDKPTKIELAVEVTAAAFDVGQTCYILANGGIERNLPTQHCYGVTLLTVGFMATEEGTAYLLHRLHHHKLERFVRLYQIGSNIRGITYSKQHGGW